MASNRLPESFGMKTIERLESQVRNYSRLFPVVFSTAVGSTLMDEDGKQYIDFFSGAGTLNYGHSDPRLKQRLIDYIASDGITHSLDMATSAKSSFLEHLDAAILKPRGLDFRIQFTGPTGSDAVEAALKLARKATGRHTVAHFVNSYHGVTLGALSVMGSVARRKSAGTALHSSLPLLFDGDLGPESDTLDYLQALLGNSENGVGIPAAIIVETIQAEGGIKVASCEWLRRLERITRQYGIVLICDDIQVGCGRTGDFFSFEAAGITPDIVCLSKSLSGYGLPMSVLLIRPTLDVWSPGEHVGTFRGNNLAFVTATEALSYYWADPAFSRSIAQKSQQVSGCLNRICEKYSGAVAKVPGRGLIQGLAFKTEHLANSVASTAFTRGLIIETCGAKGHILKLLPPLTITASELQHGLSTLECVLESVLTQEFVHGAVAG